MSSTLDTVLKWVGGAGGAACGDVLAVMSSTLDTVGKW